MIETLDEAIKHCREKAEEKRKDYERAVALNIPSEGCLECAKEHELLAEWLEQLQAIKLLHKEYERFGGGFHYQVGRVFDGDYVLDNKEGNEERNIDYIKEFPDLIVFKDAPKQELEENLPQHMPLKYKPLKFPEDGFIAKYGTRNSKK